MEKKRDGHRKVREKKVGQEKGIRKWCKQLLRIAEAYENIKKQENYQRRREIA